MNFRPAGLSSDEDSDWDNYEGFDNSSNHQAVDNDDSQEEQSSISQLEYLKLAICDGNLQDVIKLIDTGIDINEEIPSLSWTPLFYAASLGRYEILHIFLDHGALPDYRKGLYTPLMAVCECKIESMETIYKCVKLLIEFGAKVNTADKHGITPLMYACQQGHIDVVKLMIPFSDLEAEDSQGWTALFYAVSRNHIEIVEILLSEGANICKCDFRGSTARQIAIDKGFMNTADMVTDAKEKEALIISELENFSAVPQWKSMFPDTDTSKKKPHFFEDVKSFMVGVNLERRIPLLEDHNISFTKLLTMTDGELESIGFQLPYERRIILHNIHRFHDYSWSIRSLRLPPKLDDFTVFDGIFAVGTASKHIKIINSSFHFINKRLEANINIDQSLKNENEKQNILLALKKCQENLNAVKKTIIRLQAVTKEIESNTTPPADYIGPNNFKGHKFKFLKNIIYNLTISTLLCMTVYHRKTLLSKILTSVNFIKCLRNYFP